MSRPELQCISLELRSFAKPEIKDFDMKKSGFMTKKIGCVSRTIAGIRLLFFSPAASSAQRQPAFVRRLPILQFAASIAATPTN
jgi:hypothetical protein